MTRVSVSLLIGPHCDEARRRPARRSRRGRRSPSRWRGRRSRRRGSARAGRRGRRRRRAATPIAIADQCRARRQPVAAAREHDRAAPPVRRRMRRGPRDTTTPPPPRGGPGPRAIRRGFADVHGGEGERVRGDQRDAFAGRAARADRPARGQQDGEQGDRQRADVREDADDVDEHRRGERVGDPERVVVEPARSGSCRAATRARSTCRGRRSRAPAAWSARARAGPGERQVKRAATRRRHAGLASSRSAPARAAPGRAATARAKTIREADRHQPRERRAHRRRCTSRPWPATARRSSRAGRTAPTTGPAPRMS